MDRPIHGPFSQLSRRGRIRRGRSPRLAALVLAVASAAACHDIPEDLLVIAPPRFGAGTVELRIVVGTAIATDTLEIRLDGADWTGAIRASEDGIRTSSEVGGGDHEVFARAARSDGGDPVETRLHFTTPPGFGGLVDSAPAPDATGFTRAGWIRLGFDADVDDAAIASLAVECDGQAQEFRAHRARARVVIVDPTPQLPAGALCRVRWRGARGPQALAFATTSDAEPAQVLYDRRNRRLLAPFPDDFWLATNPEDPTEEGLRIRAEGYGLPDQWLMNALSRGVRDLDGFSPIGHITVPLSEAAQPESLPSDFAESLAADATLQLFDLTAGDPDYGLRVPFRVEARSEVIGETVGHALLVFPSVTLESRHRYGLVLTRGATSVHGQPFEPSPFLAELMAGGEGGTWTVVRARELVDEVLAAAAAARVPIPREDVALALRFTVRSTDGIGRDLLRIRDAIRSDPAPNVQIRRVRAESAREKQKGSAVAAIVRGVFSAADWRDSNGRLARDPRSGAPVVVKRRAIPFVLALPEAARSAPVPVIFYQHGNPGSASDEVPRYARQSLAAEGFAVIGFTDVLNREVAPPGPPPAARANRQIMDILVRILASAHAPEHFAQTVAEQLTFLRAIEVIAEREGFQIGPANTPIFGIDPAAPPLYLGVSEGAHHGVVLLPLAPEIRAAALVSPGRRFSEILIHQRSEQFLAPLSFLGFGRLGPVDLWVTLAMIQMLFDDQDPHNFAPALYREPFALGDDARASLLVVEGIGDSLVPNHATHALLRALGPVVHLGAQHGPVEGLAGATGWVAGNVDARTSAAFYQFVPEDTEGYASTPGCAAPPLSQRSAREGHYCAQGAAEAIAQRDAFLRSALSDPAPRIADPVRVPRDDRANGIDRESREEATE